MALYLNSTKIGSEAYNVHGSSTKLNKIMLGSTKVWEGLPPYYSDLKSGTMLTQSQWLEFLNGGGIAKVIQMNDQVNFRGKQVQVENSQTSSYKNWIIADFNHDNTSETCDLIQANVVKDKSFGKTQYYESSTIRTWLTGEYYDGFSTDIKNKINIMAVISNGQTLNDKVKLLSATEVYADTGEGTAYPIFTGNADRVRTGVTNQWRLRTRNTSNSNYVWWVDTNGSVSFGSSISSFLGIVPCIRFS